MQDLITIKEAADILGVTLSTASYYVRTGKLAGIESDKRTAHRKKHKLVDRAQVLALKSKRDNESGE
jgi:transposase